MPKYTAGGAIDQKEGREQGHASTHTREEEQEEKGKEEEERREEEEEGKVWRKQGHAST